MIAPAKFLSSENPSVRSPQQEKAQKDLFLACDQLDRAMLHLARVPGAAPIQILEAVRGAIAEALSEFDVALFGDMIPLDEDEDMPESFSLLCGEVQVKMLMVIHCAHRAGISPASIVDLWNEQVQEVFQSEARVAA